MKIFASAMVAGLLFVGVQDVHAFDSKAGNALWGKYAIQTCRSCHKQKGLTSLDPKERSVEQWESFFVDDYQKLKDMNHDYAAVGINDRQLENIHRYLVETASKDGSKAALGSGAKRLASRSAALKRSRLRKKSQGGVQFDMAAGDAGKGRYIFRKCLACHKRQKAPIVSPGDRTKKAWDRFFKGNFRKFKKAMPQFESYNYSVSQMQHLHQFFRKYALDAEKPKTCE